MTQFNPSRQVDFCRDVQRVHMGSAPSLGLVGKTYGTEVAISWLVIQIYDLADYAGCRDKLNEFQAEMLASTIREQWGYFKLTEFMLFFQRFKAGMYGRFYGSVDPLLIAEALGKFAKERVATIAKYEQAEQRRREREDEQAHDAAVASFLTLCKRAHMLPSEMAPYCRKYNMTVSQVVAEAEDIEWLFNLGYEKGDANGG